MYEKADLFLKKSFKIVCYLNFGQGVAVTVPSTTEDTLKCAEDHYMLVPTEEEELGDDNDGPEKIPGYGKRGWCRFARRECLSEGQVIFASSWLEISM